jgi:type IV pilus assembly protein PilW
MLFHSLITRHSREDGSPALRHSREDGSPALRHSREDGSPPLSHSRENGSPPLSHSRENGNPTLRHSREDGNPTLCHSREGGNPFRMDSRLRGNDTVKSSVAGLTLIELMIALFISMLILSLVTTIFLAAEKNFRLQIALSHIQENARLAIHFLNSNLQNVGFIGCAKLTNDFPIKNYETYTINPNNRITINNNIITLRHMSVQNAYLIQSMRGYSTLHVSNDQVFSENDILIISDCKSVEIFRVKKVVNSKNEQVITTTQPLSFLYENNSDVGKFEINSFFVANTDRQTSDGQAINALYMTMNNQRKIELVEGVDEMVISLDGTDGLNITLKLSDPETALLHQTWYDYIGLSC